MLLDIISKLYIIQGTIIMKAITTGSNIVQENDINWSKRILGKEALTHIKTNIIIQDLNPIVRPYTIPSINGKERKLNILFSIPMIVDIGSKTNR